MSSAEAYLAALCEAAPGVRWQVEVKVGDVDPDGEPLPDAVIIVGHLPDGRHQVGPILLPIQTAIGPAEVAAAISRELAESGCS